MFLVAHILLLSRCLQVGFVDLKGSTDLRADVDMINTQICSKLNNVNMGLWECQHGIGHGVIKYNRQNSDAQALAQALQDCKTTSFRANCKNGLWMDFFASTRMTEILDPSTLLVSVSRKGSLQFRLCHLFTDGILAALPAGIRTCHCLLQHWSVVHLLSTGYHLCGGSRRTNGQRKEKILKLVI